MTTPDSFERQVRRRAEAIGLKLKKSRKNIRRPWSFALAESWPSKPAKRLWCGKVIWSQLFATLEDASDRLTEFEAEVEAEAGA